ncbi:MAG TPA: PDZ domain-containing protein [Xanthobacteraceae bacterium]|jgi:TPR repeat protein
MQIGRGFALVLAACTSVSLTGSNALSDAPRARILLAQTSAAEIEFWRSVADSKNSAELEAYLTAYPNGRFVPLAKFRLQELKGAKEQRATGGDPKTATPVARTSASADANVPPAPPHERMGWVGVYGRNITKERARELGLATASGIEAVSVVSDSPASRAGLKPGDVVLSFDSEPVAEVAHLTRLSRSQPPGKTVELLILRGGARQSLKVTLQDVIEAYWSKAHRGDAAAMRFLGATFRNGDSVDRDLREAVRWYRKAADANNVEAMFMLGQMYHGGFGIELDLGEAVRWYRKAAEAGSPGAMIALAHSYEKGRGVERDPREAARWFKRAADTGDAAGLRVYGVALRDGIGVEKNETLAVEYFLRATKLGHAGAFADMGFAYAHGRGVGRDFGQALRWFRQAADRGDGAALRAIGGLHEYGPGGHPKSRVEAIKFYRKAAETGDEDALGRLKALNTTPYDPQEVQQLLSDLGFNPGAVDGQPGAKTTQAIREFQKSRALPANGEASLALVGQLRNALKQKTAATKSNTPVTGPQSTGGLDFGGLTDLEKLD